MALENNSPFLIPNTSMYHVPVMLQPCIDALDIKPDGVYVDVTFGGGGHSRAILEKLTTGKLFAFDQDADAKDNAEMILKDFDKKNFELIPENFRYIRKYLKIAGFTQKVDGVLGDLGISSYQIDTPERGFSTRFDADLDMRMNVEQAFSAKILLQTYSEEKLHRILGEYGEVKNAKTLAQALVRQRANKPIGTIQELKNVLEKYAPKHQYFKYFAQVFQALRIEVNEEMTALEELLLQMTELIKPQGRLVVMSYHSLEDRLVKNFVQKGKFYGEVEKDLYGNFYTPFSPLFRKPQEASPEEIAQNPRARSAKLRAAVRNTAL